jgi:hypothetical protein
MPLSISNKYSTTNIYQLHLRRFDSNVPEWCSFSGARPLFDHRFFLIQMTSAEVAGSKNYDKSVETSAAAFHVVSKVNKEMKEIKAN